MDGRWTAEHTPVNTSPFLRCHFSVSRWNIYILSLCVIVNIFYVYFLFTCFGICLGVGDLHVKLDFPHLLSLYVHINIFVLICFCLSAKTSKQFGPHICDMMITKVHAPDAELSYHCNRISSIQLDFIYTAPKHDSHPEALQARSELLTLRCY